MHDRFAVGAGCNSEDGPARKAQVGAIEDWGEVDPGVGGKDVEKGGQVEKSCWGDGAGEPHEGEREDGKGVGGSHG